MSTVGLVLHIALLALAVVSIGGLFLRARRPARVWEPLVWIAVAVSALLLLAQGSRFEVRSTDRTFLLGYALFVWGVAAAGFCLSIRRLNRQGQGQRVFVVLSALVGLGLLILLSLPAVPQAREAARRSQCKNNLKQLAVTFHNWHDEHERFPDAAVSEEGGPPVSWRVEILPWLNSSALRDRYDATQAWDDDANLPTARSYPPGLTCPSNFNPQDDRLRFYAAYALVVGPATVFPDAKGRSISQITDGTANTLLVAEACGLNIVWTRPQDVSLDEHTVGINLPGRSSRDSPAILSSYHGGGTHFLLADGSVRFLSEKTERRTLEALISADGGEPLSEF